MGVNSSHVTDGRESHYVHERVTESTKIMNLFKLKIEDVAVQQMALYFVSGKLRRTRQHGQSHQDFL